MFYCYCYGTKKKGKKTEEYLIERMDIKVNSEDDESDVNKPRFAPTIGFAPASTIHTLVADTQEEIEEEAVNE